LDIKADAASKHVSQFSPAVEKYRPDWEPSDLARAKEEAKKAQPRKGGHYVEAFRRATEFNQE
jgi:hypothetical protein